MECSAGFNLGTEHLNLSTLTLILEFYYGSINAILELYKFSSIKNMSFIKFSGNNQSYY